MASGFRLVEQIGCGGSGVVYRAQLPSEVHGRPDVALKLLARGDRLDISQRLRDAQILRGLDHPNLVRVYAAGESTELGPFVATEFVEGSNLGQWLKEYGSPGERQAAELVRTLARALHAAHEWGVVHCDVKPQNVFGCAERLDPGRLKIGDFGLSRFVPPDGKAAVAWETGGTPGYMAPEQYWGAYDRRSDIYALGAMMIGLITAPKRHFLSDEQDSTLRGLCGWGGLAADVGARRRQAHETFRDLGLLELAASVRDPQLRAIVARCLAFEPGDRYQTAAELADDLTTWLEHRTLPAALYGYRPLERLQMLIRRCRERENFEDHSRLWGIACLAVGTSAIALSSLCTALVLLGRDPAWTRTWTASIHIAFLWIIIYPLATWFTRGRRPTAQLIGYNVIYFAAYLLLRRVLTSDRGLGDAVQFVLTGMLLGCVGMSSRYWAVFLYSGLVVLALSWPVSLASRQPWFDPFGPALVGACQGLPLLAFGISYLVPGLGPRRTGIATVPEPSDLPQKKSRL